MTFSQAEYGVSFKAQCFFPFVYLSLNTEGIHMNIAVWFSARVELDKENRNPYIVIIRRSTLRQ